MRRRDDPGTQFRPRRLATPIEQIGSHYTAVVVGSGYGGAIAASRLARSGQRVCLLERGRELQPGEYPRNGAEALTQLQVTTTTGHEGPDSGLYDLRVNEGVSVFMGCGLGGTSLLNASVSLRPESRVFDDPRWPATIKGRPEELKDGYRRAEEMLKPVPYPETSPPIPKLAALEESARRLGGRFSRPPINVTFQDGVNHVGVEQRACRLCGDCVSGCNHGSKNTTLMNYLPDARAHGAEIYTEAAVRWLERVDGRWVVHYQLVDSGRGEFAAPELFVTADVVVLAAGALGSSEILLRSRGHGLALSNCLGHRFTGNGDVAAFGYNSEYTISGVGHGPDDRRTDDPVGPSIAGLIDLRKQPRLEQGMVIEEGGIPGALAGFLPQVLATIGHGGVDTATGLRALLRQREREIESLVMGAYTGAVRNTQTYLVMTHDDDHGRVELVNDRALVDWKRAGDETIFGLVDDRLREATAAISGVHVRDPIWCTLTGDSLVTVHPLGGCVMADDAAYGVVNDRHQVFACAAEGTSVHDGLYVVDGSVVPRPLGVNPLLTISALAERAIALLAAGRGWTIPYDLPLAPPPAAPAPTLGIEFTERMSGFFSIGTTDDYEVAAERGRRDGTTLSFVLTIGAPDLDLMLRDPEHEATSVGTALAPALSSSPLVVNRGRFKLFVEDPERPGVKRMRYDMNLVAEDGTSYVFDGFKLIEGHDWLRLWPQTTTLYVTLRRGEDASGPVLGRGVLHIAPADIARQLTTLRCPGASDERERLEGIARFGRALAGALFDTYGGLHLPLVHGSPAAPRRRRDIRLPAPEVHAIESADGTPIVLTRHPGGTCGPVLLVPDVAQAARVFSLDSTPATLAEFLAAHGFEVWLLDHRGSPVLGSSGDHSLDDLALDVRVAVEHAISTTGARALPLVGHRLGATVGLMAALAGMDGLSAAVCSSDALHFTLGSRDDARAAFEAANVNLVTVEALAGSSGLLPRRCRDQLMRIRQAGHVVDRRGDDVYLPRLDRLRFPIAFLGGAADQDGAGTRQTFDVLRRQNGGWLNARQVVRGYGADDCVVGDRAARDVFPWVLHHLR